MARVFGIPGRGGLLLMLMTAVSEARSPRTEWPWPQMNRRLAPMCWEVSAPPQHASAQVEALICRAPVRNGCVSTTPESLRKPLSLPPSLACRIFSREGGVSTEEFETYRSKLAALKPARLYVGRLYVDDKLQWSADLAGLPHVELSPGGFVLLSGSDSYPDDGLEAIVLHKGAVVRRIKASDLIARSGASWSNISFLRPEGDTARVSVAADFESIRHEAIYRFELPLGALVREGAIIANGTEIDASGNRNAVKAEPLFDPFVASLSLPDAGTPRAR